MPKVQGCDVVKELRLIRRRINKVLSYLEGEERRAARRFQKRQQDESDQQLADQGNENEAS